MAAAAILGRPAETCTESFWIGYVSAAIQYVKRHPESPAELKLNNEEQFAACIRKETSGNFTNDETTNGEDQDNDDQSVFSLFSDTESSESDGSLHEEDTQKKTTYKEFILGEDEAIVDEDDTNFPEAEMEPFAMSQLNNAGNDENITSKSDIFVTKNNV
ncbi:hypothetical protein DAPPUDRAFT_261898 [Daphnia pulex]|uniref:Uncharacterized protein n=1 Tax=Daphnia pulex TaxID=6669 RepID=E9HLW4_DAPPU|nr:hypothetical protein DAPPUDRAFT_261898 [Daphnia pulex]|eukprot:EFX67270.1 hypothetical protein DAPPUDRAFT_261898 [Daphnia pulex]